MKNRLCQPLILLDDRSVLRKEEFSILSFPENPIKHWHFSGFNPLFNPKSKKSLQSYTEIQSITRI